MILECADFRFGKFPPKHSAADAPVPPPAPTSATSTAQKSEPQAATGTK
jgi:hypothetical protein